MFFWDGMRGHVLFHVYSHITADPPWSFSIRMALETLYDRVGLGSYVQFYEYVHAVTDPPLGVSILVALKYFII